MITVVGSYKGGTGKSTVSFNLAVWLATQGFNVRAIDLDPQATLTDVFEVREEEEIHPSVPVSNQLTDATDSADVQTIIDIGTADMEALQQAIGVADQIFIPVPPSQADVWSTQRFIELIKTIRGKTGLPTLFSFVNRADTNPAIRETMETQEALKMIPGLKLVMARLGNRTAFRRSFSEGLAVFEYEPRGKAAAEMNALATVMFSPLYIAG